MSARPRAPDDLPAGNGDTGPAAAIPAPGADRPARPANLASFWAIILRQFRDHVHRSTPDGNGRASQAYPPGQ